MKTPGIYITDTDLIFKALPSKKIGLAMYCKSFKIPLESITFIAISPRLVLDDEALFVLIIDHNFKLHKIPYAYQNYLFEKFDNYFLTNPIHIEWQKFEYEDHYGKFDKILYPKEYYWQDLFKDNWKLKLRPFITLFHPKSCFGDFNPNLN
ncbi:MAG: hypothetical protein AAF611_20400 [Bacteroidota bacterium]